MLVNHPVFESILNAYLRACGLALAVEMGRRGIRIDDIINFPTRRTSIEWNNETDPLPTRL